MFAFHKSYHFNVDNSFLYEFGVSRALSTVRNVKEHAATNKIWDCVKKVRKNPVVNISKD